jgi:maleylpyruvate isomerase
MDERTARLLALVEPMSDEDFAAPTALPGWTRAHLISHLHFNALALNNLATWAITGVETPMYESAAQRNDDIERGAKLAPRELVRLLGESAGVLSAALDQIEDWDAPVVTAQGRDVAVSEVPWLRTREVALHAIDLDLGATFDEIPADLGLALAADVMGKRFRGGEGGPILAWLTGRAKDAPEIGDWL